MLNLPELETFLTTIICFNIVSELGVDVYQYVLLTSGDCLENSYNKFHRTV
jgi:hypothetical protein